MLGTMHCKVVGFICYNQLFALFSQKTSKIYELISY